MFNNMEVMQNTANPRWKRSRPPRLRLPRGSSKSPRRRQGSRKSTLKHRPPRFRSCSATKSVEKAIEIQTNFAKKSFESFVAQSTKVGELYTSLVTEALKPAEQIIAKTDATANATHPVVSKTKAAA